MPFQHFIVACFMSNWLEITTNFFKELLSLIIFRISLMRMTSEARMWPSPWREVRWTSSSSTWKRSGPTSTRSRQMSRMSRENTPPFSPPHKQMKVRRCSKYKIYQRYTKVLQSFSLSNIFFRKSNYTSLILWFWDVTKFSWDLTMEKYYLRQLIIDTFSRNEARAWRFYVWY